jgi:hypothetical protein
MRRIILLATLTTLIAIAIGGFHEWSIARAATQTCSNSFPSDGHNGPWYTTGGGGTLHANTVKISCPNQSTAWNINYGVQFRSNGVWSFWTFEHITGHGDYQFNDSYNPKPCGPNGDVHYVFPLRTHVGNNRTGGNINKPGNDSGVINLCG